ncbi:hypothetical protein CMALT394_540028 [Carnobacterium maltaromaticum]|nr:hypothetical protein CMALT394_540028 [Carnobacterium maltaromaticum]
MMIHIIVTTKVEPCKAISTVPMLQVLSEKEPTKIKAFEDNT